MPKKTDCDGLRLVHSWFTIDKMDWLEGEFTGKHHIQWENRWCPVDLPLTQSVDKSQWDKIFSSKSSAVAPIFDLQYKVSDDAGADELELLPLKGVYFHSWPGISMGENTHTNQGLGYTKKHAKPPV